MKPKVYIIKGDSSYSSVLSMFSRRGWQPVGAPEEAHLLQFLGGSDVDPSYYGETKHATTWSDPARDAREASFFNGFPDKPKAGICRGGQFLNVMNGGKMWQNVDKHPYGTHQAEFVGGLVIPVSSDHHQMMRPSEEAVFLGWATISTKRETADTVDTSSDFLDAEAVWYGRTASLCFQGHPEYYGYGECEDVYFNLLEQLFNLKAA